MKASKIFEREIGFIKNETMRKIVTDTLDAAPECITVIPASSSGKFHPKADLGNGGLNRHVKTVVAVCRSLMDSDNFKNIVLGVGTVDEEILHIYEDIALAACILHDCCKPDGTPKHSTVFDHPLKAAKLFEECAKKHITDDNINYMKVIIPIIYNAIASHMGKWTTAPYARGIVLPAPKTGVEIVVHLCDYLASRKFFDMNFDAYAESKW